MENLNKITEKNSDLNSNPITKREPNINQNLTNRNDKDNNNINQVENNQNLEGTSSTIFLPDNQILKSEKEDINPITIEDILENDDYLNDLRTNYNSRFKKLLTTDNIKKLLKYCLLPPPPGSNIIQNQRYPYYSSQILCSPLVLLFSSSIENIIICDNENKNNKEKKSSPNNSYNVKADSNKPSSGEYIPTINGAENLEENIPVEYFQFKEYNENDEKYADISETEINKETVSKKPMSDYSKEEKIIIGIIFNEIFKMLDFIKKEDQSYIGYFQKIMNYILFNESEHMLNYLFDNKSNNDFLKKLYNHLDKAAIRNIMENMLNIMADNEDKMLLDMPSNYNDIIKGIIKELKIDYNYEKFEGICELIINTLINNSEKQLIKLVFNKEESIIIQLKYIFMDLLIKDNQKEKNKNYDKQIISIIKLICQLNTLNFI